MNLFTKTAAVAGAVALTFALASCGGNTTVEPAPSTPVQTAAPDVTPTPTDAPTDGAPTGKFAPEMLFPDQITEGQVVTVEEGRGIELLADNPPAWLAAISAPDVVAFTPGTANDGVVTNPGFSTFKPGTAEIALTNTDTGTVVNFTVEVTESTLPPGVAA